MSTKKRLSDARKRAKYLLKHSRRLLKKHGHKVDPARLAEVQEAFERLHSANAQRDMVLIYDSAEALEAQLDLHFADVRKSARREYFESIGVAVVIALLLRAFVLEAFTIPSGSMIPTLAVGDFIFVSKLSYGVRMPFSDATGWQWSEPDRGDVVVFVYPCNPKLDYIKRVVGLPGDVIDTDREGFVVVNKTPIEESERRMFTEFTEFDAPTACSEGAQGFEHYDVTLDEQRFGVLRCEGARKTERVAERVPYDWTNIADWKTEQERKFSAAGLQYADKDAFNLCHKRQDRYDLGEIPPMPWTVPEGHVFVMGDNRMNSLDGRYWGFVPFGAIKGKALFIWMSWEGTGKSSKPWDWIRWSRIFSGVHGG